MAVSSYIVRRAEALICGRAPDDPVQLGAGELRQLLRLLAQNDTAVSIAPALGEALQGAWGEADMLRAQLRVAREALRVERRDRAEAERRLRQADAKFARLAERFAGARKALGR